jgi:ABC-type transporter Mla subunit MlaD
MADDFTRSDGLADVINLLAAPIASGIRTVEQFRRGADELIRSVENLNRTMENLNETATRVNRLIADIEEPVRAMIPQLTRTIEAADQMTRLLEGPVRSTAPNIEKMVETLSSPGFASLPTQLSDFMRAVGEMSRGLGPLTQFAENAGGLFGGFKIPGMSSKPTPASAREPEADAATTAPTQPAKKTAAKKATPKKKPAAKKSSARRAD